jgi:peroxiredoxin
LRFVESTPTIAAVMTQNQATVGLVPIACLVFDQGVLRAMLLHRLKIAACTLISIGAFSVTITQALHADEEAEPPQGPAATKSASPPPVAANPNPTKAPKEKSQTKTYTVEARNLETDAPMPGVKITLNVTLRNGTGPRLKATTDPSGIVRFNPSIANEVFEVRVYADCKGYVPQQIHLFIPSYSEESDRLLFRMEKGTTIGGRVLDQHGKPVGGASVCVNVGKDYPRSRQWLNPNSDSVKTDAEGRWSFPNVPAHGLRVHLAAYHHECLGDKPFYDYTDPVMPESVLHDGSAVLRLERGTPIEGTVVAPDGKPVADAEVIYGDARQFDYNRIPPVQTDARGKFRLGIKPGVASSLTIKAPGFGPARQALRVGSEPQQLTIALPAGRTIRGRLVDTTGKPISMGTLQVTSWRDSKALSETLDTGWFAWFAWADAPSDEVTFHVSAIGYPEKDVTLGPGVHTIVLGQRTTVRGTVVDATTGRPIPKFSVTQATIHPPRNLSPSWDSDPDLGGVKKTPGAFEYPLNDAADRYILRVQAEGYLPTDSVLISPEGGDLPLTFGLEKAEPIRGTVLNPDGSPARSGSIYLVPARHIFNLDCLNRGKFWHDRQIHATIGPDGRFALPPQRDDYAIVAPLETGIAIIARDELPRDHVIHLKPWARASGTIKIDGEPIADSRFSIKNDKPIYSENELSIFLDASFKTDDNGRFEISRLVPGRHRISHLALNNAKRMNLSLELARFDVKEGEAVDLKIGDSGRKVKGVLKLPTASKTWVAWNEQIAPRGTKISLANVEIGRDGHFRAQDLRPGDYTLRIRIHERSPQGFNGRGRLVAAYTRDFSVSGGANDPPLDLGSLEPTEVAGAPLKVGDMAPDFAVKTLDGKDLKLTDFRGKLVLLHYWMVWSDQFIEEVPNLKAIHEAHARNPRFAVVALNLDEYPAGAAQLVKSMKLPGIQGFVGPDSPVVTAYGAHTVPATFLIGPDGKILAAGLRGEALKSALARALKP